MRQRGHRDRVPPADGDRPRRLGVGVLVVAAVVALSVSRLLNQGLGGQAARALLPEPPAIGTCLRVEARAIAEVSCDQLHNAEVVRTWPAGALPEAMASMPLNNPYTSLFSIDFGLSGADEFDMCWSALERYAGLGDVQPTVSELWTTQDPMISYRMIASSADPTVGVWRWAACVLTSPTVQPYVGSLRRQAGQPPDWPNEFGNCILSREDFSQVPCGQPHQVEMLGFPSASTDADMALFAGHAAEFTAGCLDVGRALTGAADPTFGGKVHILAEPVGFVQIPVDPAAGDGPTTFIEPPSCFAQVAGDRLLTGTVVGLGDAALPLE